jgi:hypothetical protein
VKIIMIVVLVIIVIQSIVFVVFNHLLNVLPELFVLASRNVWD